MDQVLIFERHPRKGGASDYTGGLSIAQDCQSGRKLLLDNNFQMILIHLEERDDEAVRFASFVREIPRYYLTPLLFLARNKNYEKWAFHDIHCYDYLIEPVRNRDLIKIIYPIYAKMAQMDHQRQISFYINGSTHVFNIDDVMYLSTQNRQVVVHTTRGNLDVPYLRLNHFSLRYRDNFIRCHRSVVVNRAYVKCVDYTRGKVELPGVTVEMGRYYHETMHRVFDGT